MKNTLQIVDRTFSHSKLGYCSDFQYSDDFQWKRNNIDSNLDTIYTDGYIGSNTVGKKENSYAWVIEPKCFSPAVYDRIISSENLYNKIFTHEKTLLDRSDKYVLNPFGCCWVPPEEQMIYDKTKNLSIISSNKTFTDGHKLRHTVISRYKEHMDVYGRGYSPIEFKLEGLKDYRFQIVIENCKRDYWFTEKLIDCFMTGTIPIYWGCPSIGDFFDTEGMIIIDNIEDIGKVIPLLDETLYLSKKEHIQKNYDLGKKYLLPDQLIYNYLK